MNPEIAFTKPYRDILALFSKGEENSKYSTEIIDPLGITRRDLCKYIETLRRNGFVIIGDTRSGYYLPNDINELESYIRREEGRAKAMLFSLKSARALRKKWSLTD